MIKLALTDLDNTLIPAGAAHASERAIAAVHRMHDAGLHFGPVTGRVPSAMRWMFAGDELCGRTGAYVNGQLVYVDGELVHEEPLSVGLLNELGDILLDHPGSALSVYDLDDVSDASDGRAYYLGAMEEELDARPDVFGKDHPVLQQLDWDRCIKANIRCVTSPEEMEALRDELRERLPQFDYVFPMAGGIFIDLLPKGWSKGRSVEVMAEHLGVSLDEVAVFGDSENDLSMLGAVENSVAVANATPEVSAAARWHIGTSADDAVASALEQIADAAERGGLPAFMQL